MHKIKTYSNTNPGLKRTNNEDAVGAFEPKDDHQLRRSGRIFIVADGMGGHQMGEKASTYSVETLLKAYYESPEIPPEKRLRDIIGQINEYLLTFARENLYAGEKIGTTIVAAVIRNETLQIAHVGDSRAYLIRNGEIRQLTTDHSFVNELIRSRAITEEEAQKSPYRNRLLRSVGGSDAKLEVDVTEPILLQAGDMLVLCTDGLTQYANSQDILAATSNKGPRESVDGLIQFANDRGGSDNISVLVVKAEAGISLPLFTKLPSLQRPLAVLGIGIVALLALVLLGIIIAGKLAGDKVLPLVTAIPTNTLIPAPTMTQTPQLATAVPTTIITPTPTVEVMVDCKYLVREGDTAGSIVENFGTDLLHLYYEDGSQDNFETIFTDSFLIINDISKEMCLNGSGEVLAATTIP